MPGLTEERPTVDQGRIHQLWATVLKPLQSRTLREGAWVAFGQVGSAVGALVGMRVLTEYLTTDAYGTLGLCLGVLALGANMVCTPLMQAAARFYPGAVASGTLGLLRSDLGRALRHSVLAYVALVLVGGVAIMGADRTSVLTLAALGGLFALESVRTFETDLLVAARVRRLSANWLVVDNCSRPLVAMLLIFAWGATPLAALAGYALATAVALVFFLPWARSTAVVPSNTTDPEGPRSYSREIWHFSLPVVAMGLVTSIDTLTNRYLIGGLVGLSEAGLYAAAIGLVARPYMMTNLVIDITLRPLYYNAIAAGDKAREWQIALWGLGATVVLCGLGTLTFTVFSRFITGIMFGARFSGTAKLIPWLALGQFFLMLSYTFHRALFAYSRTRAVFGFRCVAAVLTVVVGGAMTYKWGLMGTAIATPICYAAELVLLVSYYRARLAGNRSTASVS